MNQPPVPGPSLSTLIELPDLNGYLEAGIAAGVDPTLPEDDKLPIYGETTREVYNSAVAWASTRNFNDDRTNTLFVSGVVVIVGCGMLRTRNGVPDGDWFESNSAYQLSEESIKGLLERINRDTVTTANTIICATKLNVWLMNDHVGQTSDRNTAAGYLQKVLVLKFGTPLPPNMVQATHMLGLYASTRFILSRAGIPNILDTDSRLGPDVGELRFADNAKLRFNALPAGTQRLAVCHEAARRLSKYQFSHFCPGISDFTVLPKWKKTIMSNPALYHVQSLYLTGQKESAFSDNLFENFIGRLGTYIQIMAPRSTLCRSPHFAPARVESAPDFDVTWRNILTQINRARETVSTQQLSVEEVTDIAKEAAKELSSIFSETAPVITAPQDPAPN
jgi:hypothetical protein